VERSLALALPRAEFIKRGANCRLLVPPAYINNSSRSILLLQNKKHLRNVGPIHHCEPPHTNSPDVASGTVARRLRIDVHDNADDDNDNA